MIRPLWAFFIGCGAVVVQDLTELFEPVIQSMGYELVGVEFLGGGGHGILRVYIDQESGIGLDDCAKVSHQISGILDVEEPIQQVYDLEVSSPGLNRPLFKLADYQRFEGHAVKIKMAVPQQGRRNYNGMLQGVVESKYVQIMIDGEIHKLPISGIAKANLIVET